MTDTMSTTEKAAEVKDVAVEKAVNVKDLAVDKATDVVKEAKSSAKSVLSDTKNQLTTEAENQGQRFAASLKDVSGQMQTMVAAGDPGPVRDVAGQAADALGQFAERLDSNGVQGLFSDLAGFARRRPGAFLLGAGIAGFVVTRLVRNGAATPATPSSSGSQGALRLAQPEPTTGGPQSSPPPRSPSPSSVTPPSPVAPTSDPGSAAAAMSRLQ